MHVLLCALLITPPTPIRNPLTLEGSFSAVSTPIFAPKYASFNIFRDLQDSHTFAPFQIQKFSKFRVFLLHFSSRRRLRVTKEKTKIAWPKSKQPKTQFLNFLQNFQFFSVKFLFFAPSLMDFLGILRRFVKNSENLKISS